MARKAKETKETKTVEVPDFDGATADLTALIEKPETAERAETPLQEFVRLNYELLQKAIDKGHSKTEICNLLKSKKIPGAYTKKLNEALDAETKKRTPETQVSVDNSKKESRESAPTSKNETKLITR